MKNKKGFTLVELLAVIAILALLVIIAMPNILKRFNQAKKDTFITEVKKVYSEVTDAYVNNTLSGTHKTLYSSETNDLDMTGDIKYCVVTDTQGNIEYMEVADGSFYSTYDKTKQIEKYNSSDANDLPEDYSMNCKSISKNYNRPKVEPKYCKQTDVTKVKDGEYIDGLYIYKYEKENVFEIKFIEGELYPDIDYIEWNDNKNLNGYGVQLKNIAEINSEFLSKDEYDNKYIDKLDEAPCAYIEDEKNKDSYIPITSMANMFVGAEIVELNLSNFYTTNVVNMQGMFSNLEVEKISGIKSLNTSNVKDMSMMFAGLEITASDNSNFFENISFLDTTSVTDMSMMFSEFMSEEINLSGISEWTTSQVKNMSGMFLDAGNKVGLKKFNLGNIGEWDVSNVTSMKGMFSYAAGSPDEESTLTWYIGNLNDWDTKNVTDMSAMFCGAGVGVENWSIGDISKWDTSNVTNMSGMFSSAGYFSKIWNIGKLDNWNVSKVTDMSYMFTNAGANATEWNVGDLNTKEVNINGNKYIAWDTSNVTSMESMFYCAGLEATTWNIGKLDNWNVSKVTTMDEMFYTTCHKAKKCIFGNLSEWDTKELTTMHRIFANAGYNAEEFRTGDITKWETPKLKDSRNYLCRTAHHLYIIGDLEKNSDAGTKEDNYYKALILFNSPDTDCSW